jgi:Dienelactone hydrolase family
MLDGDVDAQRLGHAEQWPWLIDEMKAKLAAAGVESKIIVYPNAGHGFFADYRPEYERSAAEAHSRRRPAGSRSMPFRTGARTVRYATVVNAATRRGQTIAVCAKRTAGVDAGAARREERIAVGQLQSHQSLPPGGFDLASVRQPVSSACASAISGISGVGAKPSSAGARTAWASTGRPADL